MEYYSAIEKIESNNVFLKSSMQYHVIGERQTQNDPSYMWDIEKGKTK